MKGCLIQEFSGIEISHCGGAGETQKTNKMGNGRDGVVEVKTCMGLEVGEGKFSCTFCFVCQSRSKGICTA